jgi:hypothetical protein
MKISIIIYSNDAETVWNGFRFASINLVYDNEVTVFLLGKGVEAMSVSSLQYNVKEQLETFREAGGKLVGCNVCCENRSNEMPYLRESLSCEMGSMEQLYSLTADSDKVITF